MDDRALKQLELLRKGDRDRVKNGVVLLILGIVVLVAAFWIRVKIEVSTAFFAQQGNEWMLPAVIQNLVSSYFSIRVAFIAGVVLCALGLRELLDRNHRALLLLLADDLERRHKTE